ncbi:MAG: M10 family metallopeptidase C-terminal domain-containing protein [Rhizomicrobium sp.]|jgi:Ca2+-binding RTX toxin-like protein
MRIGMVWGKTNSLRWAVRVGAAAALSVAASGIGHASPIVINGQLPKGHCTKAIYGTHGDDVLDGSDSRCDETIFGLPGNDVLIGGRGKNVLIGGRGQDTLTGGAKNFDTLFVFRAHSSEPQSPDVITDFVDSGPFADYISLVGVCPKSGCTFLGTTAFSSSAGEIRYEVLEKKGQSITELMADSDGDGSADLVVDLVGAQKLTKQNVLFR